MSATYSEIRAEAAKKQFGEWWAKQGFTCESGDEWAAKSLAEKAFVEGAAWGDDAIVALLRAAVLNMILGEEGSWPTAIVKIAAIRDGKPIMGLGMVVNTPSFVGEAGDDAIAGACTVAYGMIEEVASRGQGEGHTEEVGEEGRPM